MYYVVWQQGSNEEEIASYIKENNDLFVYFYYLTLT